MACSLCKAVGDRNHRCFLRSQHVAEVRWEILEESLLRRADVPENCSQAKLAEQSISYVSNGWHVFLLIYSSHFFTVYLPVTSESRERSLAEDLLQVVFHMRGESVLHPPPRSRTALCRCETRRSGTSYIQKNTVQGGECMTR